MAPWALLASIGMLLYAPFRSFAILPIMIMWVFYYLWIYVENKNTAAGFFAYKWGQLISVPGTSLSAGRR
ncbi:hypothetical protein [Bacillus infantis]|uniref:hypothetical protein n=1 Tax=Bacillus infantis TaxID=324767 RepID=UPI001653C731|nr:hypothetical protein [Bacillus infantis]